ncbi:MAG TPA: hypothetical protein VFU21_32800 [Kofleriaceae bacterium]|nr:hypothetical protein [Kofleriaceae bacterium]
MHRVGYATGVWLLLFGTAVTCAASFVLGGGPGLLQLLLGALATFLGIRCATTPALVITEAGQVQLISLFGAHQVIPIRSIGDVYLRGRTLYVRGLDGRSTLLTGCALLDRGDIARLREAAMPTARLVSSTDG